MPGRAPVERVGGTVESGPWPEDVDEVVAGETYEREVPAPDGVRTVTRTVRVDEVEERPDGGTVVSVTYVGDPE